MECQLLKVHYFKKNYLFYRVMIIRKVLGPYLLNFKSNKVEWKVGWIMHQKNWSFFPIYLSFSVCKMGEPFLPNSHPCSEEKMRMPLCHKQFSLGYFHNFAEFHRRREDLLIQFY